MSLFQKCENFTDAKEAKAMDLYPYFHELQSQQDVEVIMEGKRRIMLGSNNYLGLDHPRIGRQAEIVVGGEVDQLLPLDPDHRAVGSLKNVDRIVKPLAFQVPQIAAEKRLQSFAAHENTSIMISAPLKEARRRSAADCAGPREVPFLNFPPQTFVFVSRSYFN
mgnify:CR=1 FL=1